MKSSAGRRKAHCRAKVCRQDRRCQEARGLLDRQEDRQEERGQPGGEGHLRRERFACARRGERPQAERSC